MSAVNYLVIFALFLPIIYCKPSLDAKPGAPVILVPGDGGSQFEAKLNKTTTVHYWCTKTTKDYFPLWLNLELMAPYVLDCLVDNMRLVYDNKTRTTSNNQGVQIRQPAFGNTSSVEWLDASQLGATAYYNPLVKAMVTWGYTRNINIRGAPYDFRKAPNEMQHFIDDLKKLVEDTYATNDNQKVVLIGHSMGNPYLLTLLNQQNRGWKNKYVKTYVSLSAPWGGAAKTMRLMASGDNLGVFVVNPLTARPQQRSMPSTAWLMPYDTFWNETEVIMTGPYGNYTVADYKRFFQDIKFRDGYDMRLDTEPLTLKKLKAPEVEVHCLHGVNVPTPAKFNYTKAAWYDDQPDVTFSDGDGTVNMRSLHGCLRWVGKNNGKQIIHHTFNKTDHMQILANKDMIAYVKTVLYS